MMEDASLEPIIYWSAGGVLVAGERVLLLVRAAPAEIRLPKGHIDPGESAAETALREVEEESGYGHLEIVRDLGSQEVRFVLDGRPVHRHERYFLLRPAGGVPTMVSPPESQFTPAWVGWAEAEEQLTFEAEKEWLRRARQAWEREQAGLP